MTDDATHKINEKDRQAFRDLVSLIPLKQRNLHRAKIDRLEAIFCSGIDPIKDGRGAHWAKCRAALADKKTVLVTVRGAESWQASYIEAGKFVGRSPSYIKTALYKGAGEMFLMVAGAPVTLRRLSAL